MSNNKQGNLNIPEIRFPEFDEHWKEVNLKSIATFSKGKGISKNDISENGIPCIRYGELYTKYNENITDIYSKTNLEKSNLVMSEDNDILIPCSGETAIDLATASCVREKNVAIGGDITIIKTNQYAPFITYCINNKRTEIAKYAQGVSIVHLYAKDFQNMKIKIPQISEQKKIVNLLENVSKKIDSLEKKYILCNDFKKYAIDQIFTNNLKFKNDDEKNYDEWDQILLKDADIEISDGNYGEAYPKEKDFKSEGIPFIRSVNIQDSKLTFKDMKYISLSLHEELLQGHLKEDDVLITTRGDIGLVAYVTNEFANSNINAQICLLRVNNKNINPKFLFYLLSTHFSQKQLLKFQTGSALKQLPKNNLKNLELLVPQYDEQKKIVDFLEAIDKNKDLVQENISKMKKFKKGLLQKMFV